MAGGDGGAPEGYLGGDHGGAGVDHERLLHSAPVDDESMLRTLDRITDEIGDEKEEQNRTEHFRAEEKGSRVRRRNDFFR